MYTKIAPREKKANRTSVKKLYNLGVVTAFEII